MMILNKNKASVCAVFKSGFLGKPQMIFLNWVESYNPEKLPVRSTLCTWGKEKWPLCVFLEMAPNWDWGQLCLCPGPKSQMESAPAPPCWGQFHPDSGKPGPCGCGGTEYSTDGCNTGLIKWCRNHYENGSKDSLWVACSQETLIFFFFYVYCYFVVVVWKQSCFISVIWKHFILRYYITGHWLLLAPMGHEMEKNRSIQKPQVSTMHKFNLNY